MRGKTPTPFWKTSSLFPSKQMYELSISRNGIIRGLRRGNGHLSRVSTYENIHLCNGLDFTVKNGFAKLLAYNGPVEFDYCSVLKWNPKIGNDCAIHCFGEDKDLEGPLWRRLEQTTKRIKDCKLIVAPDFSLYIEPRFDALNRDQVRRSRQVAAFWQACGLNVVPLASWGSVDSFEYCFDGLPVESVIACSATSCHTSIGAWHLWQYAVKTIIERLHPTRLLIYGDPKMDFPFDVPVTFIPDHIHKYLRKL